MTDMSVTEELRQALLRAPAGLRFGQLIYNAVCWDLLRRGKLASERNIGWEFFYMEDQNLADIVTEYVAVMWPMTEVK